MTNFPTSSTSIPYSPQIPQPVSDATQSSDVTPVSGETVTFLSSAAASSTGINVLDKGPIMNVESDRVGSYWGDANNLVYTATHEQGKFRTVVETASSAVVTIFDDGRNLEQLFETVTGSTLVKRFVIKVTDVGDNVLYGWSTDIAVTSDVYTIDIYNHRLTEGNQNWVGTLGNFDNTNLKKVEVFKYSSSIAWTTGSVLTEEVGYPYQTKHQEDIDFLQNLSAGQFAVDYMRGRLLFKKATTGTSDTIAYNSRGSQVVASGGSLEISSLPTATPESGTDAVGEDTYATVVTPSTTFEHIMITNEGTNPATVSLDAGITDHFIRVPGASIQAFDGVAVTATAIQAKNASGGNNYANLTVTVW